MNRACVLLAGVSFAVLTALAIHVKNASFPFAELAATGDAAEFDAPPGRGALSYDVPPLCLEPSPAPTESGIVAAVRRLLRPGGEAILSSPDVVLRPPQPRTLCSEYAKLAASVATAEGIPARVVWLSGHTVSEIWRRDLSKWVLVDANGNQMFVSPGGTPLGVMELASGAPARMSRLLETDPTGDDPLFGPEAILLYRRTRVCVVLEGPRVYDFQERNRSPSVLLGYLLGGEPVARGIQYVPPGKTPEAGSVIVTLRVVLGALATFWMAVTGRAVVRRRRRRVPSDSAGASRDRPRPTPPAR